MAGLRCYASPFQALPASRWSHAAVLSHQTFRPLRKRFSSSPQSSFIEPAIAASHTLIDGVHAITGLSWAATLASTALLVRLSMSGPISIYTRKAQQRQLSLQPVLHAWEHQLRKTILRDAGHLGPAVCESRLKKARAMKRRELYKRWRCGWWKNWLPLAQMPVFLLLLETIRRMCGTHEGLLGLLTRQFTAKSVSAETGRDAVISALQNGKLTGVEPTFIDGGALWFQDLLVPDPLLILPFVLSGSIFLNIYLSNRSAELALAGRAPSKFQRRLGNSLKVMALVIGPATLQVPTAILVYWISSSIFAVGQHQILDKWMPLQAPIRPCKLPPNTLNMPIRKSTPHR